MRGFKKNNDIKTSMLTQEYASQVASNKLKEKMNEFLTKVDEEMDDQEIADNKDQEDSKLIDQLQNIVEDTPTVD